MQSVTFGDKSYQVDNQGFLTNKEEWDRGFVEAIATDLGIAELSEDHWRIIEFIRKYYKETGECPLFYKTCRSNGLGVKHFKELFPTGYLRGACRLAGVTFRDEVINYYGEKVVLSREEDKAEGLRKKSYRVDAFGFLIDPEEWDEQFALGKAIETNVPNALSDLQLRVVKYLRDHYNKTGSVPTVIMCCEDNNLEIEDLEKLFPHGYHRSAVKLAGLRV